MKMSIIKLLSLTLFLFQASNSTSQTQEENIGRSENDTEESVKEEIENLNKAIEELKELIQDDSSSKTEVGVFNLFETVQVPVYMRENGKYKAADFKINIEKVILDINNGAISDIQVQTSENKTFTNSLTSTPVNQFERCDLLAFNHGFNTYFIKTCDFLDFERIGSFEPNDIRFSLEEKGETKSLTKDTGLNSIIELRIYSDLLGTFNGEDNGLIQTEADVVIPLNRKNMRNKPIHFLYNIKAGIKLSKFDEKFKYTNVQYQIADTTINSNDTTYILADTSFSRQTLNQRNWFNFDLGLNIIAGKFSNKSKNSYSLDLIAGFSLSNFASNDDTSLISLPYFGFHPKLEAYPAPNFGISLSSKIAWQYAPQLAELGFGETEIILSPVFELFWHPLNTTTNKIFTRVSFVNMIGDRTPVYQWQLGYNLSISDFIEKVK